MYQSLSVYLLSMYPSLSIYLFISVYQSICSSVSATAFSCNMYVSSKLYIASVLENLLILNPHLVGHFISPPLNTFFSLLSLVDPLPILLQYLPEALDPVHQDHTLEHPTLQYNCQSPQDCICGLHCEEPQVLQEDGLVLLV